MAFVLLQDGSLFLSELRKQDLDTARPIDMSCPLRTRFRSGRNAADTYGCKGRSLSAGVTLRPLIDISIGPTLRNQQFFKIRQKKGLPGGWIRPAGASDPLENIYASRTRKRSNKR